MEWIETLARTIVGPDTAPLIYLIEENPIFLPFVADQYRRILLHANHVTTEPVSEIIADEAAQLRARHGLRTPDAIQLATAIRAGASSFVTNDSRLPRLAPLNMLVLNHLIAKTP